MGRKKRRHEKLSEPPGTPAAVSRESRAEVTQGDPLGDLTAETERLGAAFEGAPLGMVIKDARGALLRSNPAFRRMLGYEEEELRGMARRDFTHPEDVEKDAELYSELLNGGREGGHEDKRESFQIEKRYVKKGGGVMWGRLSVSRLGGDEGEPPLAMGVVEDISELKRAEAALGASESRFRAVVEQSPLSIHVFAPDGSSMRANDSWNHLWYLGEGEEPEGANVFEDEQLRVAGLLPYAKDGAAGVGSKIPPLYFDPARAGREGEPRWLEGVVYPLRDASGEITEVTLMLDDITERKALEEELAHRALHDPLTNLPNRTLFLDRLGQALVRSPGRGSRREGIAVLFLDLDDLKRVNDSLGHDTGDELLVEVARRLGSRLRPADTLARLAGDEFVILLEEVGEQEATRTAQRIIGGFDAPFTISGQEIFVSVSVGIALSKRSTPPTGQRPEQRPGQPAGDEADILLRHADLAMYEAKKLGKARHVLYEERMGQEAGARLELERGLRRALVREEIEVFYQPKVSLRDGYVAGIEALARWRHSERGLLLPQEFIPLAEQTGLIVDLGYQVLRIALRQAARWRERWSESSPESQREARTEGPWRGSPPVVWVNLSARQFHEPDLARRISSLLTEVGVEPEALGFEITESILVEDASPSVSLLEDLKRLGVKLAVDDFGTGYSSLSYLTRLPVDYLKIDRSFIAGLGAEDESSAGHGTGNATIVSAVIGLARAMGMKVVAEGVETEEQLSRLKEMGCDLAQGYHFARPLPVEDTSAYLLRSGYGRDDGADRL